MSPIHDCDHVSLRTSALYLRSHDKRAQVNLGELYNLGVDSLEKVLEAMKSEDAEEESEPDPGSNGEEENHDEAEQQSTEITYPYDKGTTTKTKLANFVFHPDKEQVPYMMKYLACFCIDTNRWKTARERKKRECEAVRGMGYVTKSILLNL